MKRLAAVAAAALLVAVPAAALAQEPADGLIHGVVIAVEVDEQLELASFTVVDGAGLSFKIEARGGSFPTEYGLEDSAGERWVSDQAAGAAEAATRLVDHQRRFAPVTVRAEGGVALSVVERESADLETNLGFLFAIFAVTWAGFFAYIFVMSRRQRDLQHEIASLRALMSDGAGSGG